MDYKFTIEYKKGSTNRASDALSRRQDGQLGARFEEDLLATEDANASVRDCALLTAAAHPVPQLLELLRSETKSSLEMREIVTSISDGKAPPHLSFVDGLVYHHRRIFVGSRSSVRRPILQEYHCSLRQGIRDMIAPSGEWWQVFIVQICGK